MFEIRRATIEDAKEIAKVHVNSWRTTYKHIIADSVLDNLSVDKRQKKWEWTFNHPQKDEMLFIALNDDGELVGFSSGGKSRNQEFEHDGELYAIYILKEYQRKGIGKLLLKPIVESLKNRGYSSMMVWVLEKNPSKTFYKALGGEVIGQKVINIGGEMLNEEAYGWNKINKIEV